MLKLRHFISTHLITILHSSTLTDMLRQRLQFWTLKQVYMFFKKSTKYLHSFKDFSISSRVFNGLLNGRLCSFSSKIDFLVQNEIFFLYLQLYIKSENDSNSVSQNLFLCNQDQLYQSFWFIMQWLKLEENFTYLEGGFLIRMVAAFRKKSTNWPASLEIVNGQHWSSKWKLPEHIRLSSLWMILFVHQIEIQGAPH